MPEVYIINKNKRKLFWPILLILIGLYLLAENLDLIPREYLSNLWRFWPVVLIAFGLSKIYQSNKDSK